MRQTRVQISTELIGSLVLRAAPSLNWLSLIPFPAGVSVVAIEAAKFRVDWGVLIVEGPEDVMPASEWAAFVVMRGEDGVERFVEWHEATAPDDSPVTLGLSR